jgi:hypothetical protein
LTVLIVRRWRWVLHPESGLARPDQAAVDEVETKVRIGFMMTQPLILDRSTTVARWLGIGEASWSERCSRVEEGVGSS